MTRNEWTGVWEVLGCEWTFPILRHLKGEGLHFNELKRQLEDAPPSTVSTRLQQLEEEGLVDRTVEGTSPKLVRYELTDRGNELRRILSELATV